MDRLRVTSAILNSSRGAYYENFTCFSLPPKVNSQGLARFILNEAPGIFQYSLPNLEFQMVAIFFITAILNFFVKKKGIPPLVPQIITGVLFSPQVLPGGIADVIFTPESAKAIGTLTTLAYQLFVFHSGVQMEVGMVRNVGWKVLASSIICAIIPILVGIAALTLMSIGSRDGIKIISDVFTSAMYSMTSFPVIVSILNDLKLVNSELGRLGLSTALVSDILSLVLFTSSYLAKTAAEGEVGELKGTLIAVFTFIFFVVFMLRPALKLFVGKPGKGKPAKDLHIYVIISLAMVSVFFTHDFKLFLHYGPFIVGLAVPAGSSLGAGIVDLLDVVQGYFIPLFISVCAMRIDFSALHEISELAALATASISISLTKFFVSFISQTYFWKMPTNDATAFSLLLCAKGVSELAIYSYFTDIRLFSQEQYAHMVLSVLFFGGIVPMLVKYLYSPHKRYARHEKRNLMNADPNSDLKIIACIHAPGDVKAALKLLEASCKGESPIAIDVLHLIKLVAQSTPIRIKHPKDRVILCNYVYSINVIRLLNEFEQNNLGCAKINAFTAVSPPSLMYDDISALAFDQRASFVILPFHVRWNHQEGIGSVSQGKNMRDLNISVLERAPCSIGILADRYKNTASIEDSSIAAYKIAMIFLGGADDREALVFAMNMAKDTKVNLTVLQLTKDETDYEDEDASDDELDDVMEVKRDYAALKSLEEIDYITCRSMVSNDAPTTASIIRTMVNKYELIIVGRRSDTNKTAQTAGLEEWCEYPELGVLGDLLLARDTKGTCSTLVVQQDQHQASSTW